MSTSGSDRPLRVLVTGATGFLGGHTLAALQTRDDVEVVAACRSPERLSDEFDGDVRAGDMTDASYRREVVQGIDVVCHTGTWGSFWGHEAQERSLFFDPAVDLMEQAIAAGVGRLLVASTVAIGTLRSDGSPIDDDSPTQRTGYWPHLDRLVDLDDHMRANAHRGTQMVTMRLGHFLGAGNRLGMVPALAPRLRTRMVPWLAGGRARLPLVSGQDMGEAFALAATADHLDDYESFHVVGGDQPTAREVIGFVAEVAGVAAPRISVPVAVGFAFGWLMERLHPVLPGGAPFLTRSLVYVSQDWHVSDAKATTKLGYKPQVDWRDAVRETLDAMVAGAPWPALAQPVSAPR